MRGLDDLSSESEYRRWQMSALGFTMLMVSLPLTPTLVGCE
jgi:hypothetical protein